jgi:hypothetical protein
MSFHHHPPIRNDQQSRHWEAFAMPLLVELERPRDLRRYKNATGYYNG